MKLTPKLVLAFLFTALIPFAVLGSLSYSSAKAALEKQALEDLTLAAEAEREHLYTFFEALKGRVLDFSSDGFIRDSAEAMSKLDSKDQRYAELQKALSEHLLRNKLPLDESIHLILITDASGRVVSTTNNAEIGSDVSKNDYFRLGSSEAYAGGMFYTHQRHGEMRHIVAAAPLRGRETGAFLGVITNYYHMNDLDKILSGTFGRRETLDIYLVNMDNLLITPSRFGGEVLKQRIDTPPVQECAEGREMAGVYKNHLGSEVLGASMCIPAMDWTLVTEISTSEAFAPVMALRNVMVVLGIALAMLAFLLAYVLAIGISSPMIALSGATRKLAAGDFSARAKVRSQDEIGELASSFNKMVQQLGESQSALRVSEERFRSVAQSANDAIISADGSDKIMSWNKGAQTIFGYAEEEALGKSLTILIPERYREAHQKGVERVVSTGESRVIGKTVELHGLRKDGSEFPLELSLSSWKTKEGIFFTGIIRDITERRRAEEELKTYAAKLEDANSLKELFTDVMRHDLLNPAGVIKNFAELLIGDAKDENQKKIALSIKRNSDKLIGMIEDASMLAKLESAEKLESGKRDLNEILKSVIESFQLQLQEKRMKLEHLAKSECPAMVNQSIENVFTNLLSNAIKYSPEGGKIETNILDEGKMYRIYVKDWGYGIRDEDKHRIFNRFQRADKWGVKGTGLGLSIAKRVVELHGGRVWVEDNAEGGSIFYVELPKS